MIDMPGDLVAAIKIQPQVVWERFFDALIMNKMTQIEGRESHDLPNLKAEIKQIREMKNYWISQYSRT